MKNRKDAILEAYRSSQERVIALESELATMRQQKDSEIIPIHCYQRDVVNRWAIHSAEVKALVNDVTYVYKSARRVELPQFLKN